MTDRSESDNSERKLVSTNSATARNRTFIVMIIIVALAMASGGKAFNALGLKNNIAIIAQLGIIATGAALLMIAGNSTYPLHKHSLACQRSNVEVGLPLDWERQHHFSFFDYSCNDAGVRMANRHDCVTSGYLVL